MASSFLKDPDAVLDYQHDWSDWLGSDTIDSASWIVDSGLTEDSSTNTSTATTIWLSGGTAAEKVLTRYKVVSRIVTVAGRTNDRTIYIVIAPTVSYITLEQLKNYVGVEDATDDVLLWEFILASQKQIDISANRTFAVGSDTTRTMDAIADVEGALLWLDGDLCSITSITNGDGTTVTASEYVTEPRRATPYYGIRLLSSSGVGWTYSTDHEDAISVTGKWGYSETPPADKVELCLELAAWLYRLKDNRGGDQDRAVIAGNATILPASMPQSIRHGLVQRAKLTI